MKRILVIRYGAFGDIVLSMSAFRSIRAHHAGDHLTVLTTRAFGELLRASLYFDEIVIDNRLKPWRLPGWLRLVGDLRRRRFDRVYDLQRNERTSIIYRLIGAGRLVEWSGVIPGCSHYVRDDPGDRRHIVDRLEEQLIAAGLDKILPPDITWLRADVGRFGLPPHYALVASGGAPHRLAKRAPAACFAGLGSYLLDRGITPVLLGTASEREQIDAIRQRCGGAIDLSDKTSFGEIAQLARGAVGAVGNDTGIMHLAAAAGCASLMLFSAASDPARIAPRGRQVHILQCDTLADLPAVAVIAAWEAMLG
jgi:ADP-heptose:LPS heptosyltransferase